MFKPNYDEDRLWEWYEKIKADDEKKDSWNERNLEFNNSLERKKELVKKINTAINNINRIIAEMWQNSDVLEKISKKIKGVPTFDACAILIWEIENICDRSYIPILEEYRYYVNTARQDIELMNIIEENLKICFELNNIKKKKPEQTSRKSQNPFWTIFYKSY